MGGEYEPQHATPHSACAFGARSYYSRVYGDGAESVCSYGACPHGETEEHRAQRQYLFAIVTTFP